MSSESFIYSSFRVRDIGVSLIVKQGLIQWIKNTSEEGQAYR